MGVEAQRQLERLVGLLSELPQVEAVALGGSSASETADELSDFDVYVFPNAVIPLETRRDIVQKLGGASEDNLGHDYFGGGDEWKDAAGTHFDLMYFGLDFYRDQVERPLKHHQPSLGYSTAFAYTVGRAQILYDPDGTFAELQALTHEPYPDALRENVVRYNHPMLRGTISSYRAQLAKAAARGDLVSVNHRVASLLAGYFDIVFAVNRLFHPGEKRLLATVLATCPDLPENLESDVTAVLTAGDGTRTLVHVDRLLDALDAWLGREGLRV